MTSRLFKPEDIEKLLRYPQKGDPLVPSPLPLDRYHGDPAYACALGYRLAAQILVEHTRRRNGEAYLFYPIIFLYRHHVELMLKNLILALDAPCVRKLTQAEELSESNRESLAGGKQAHSLQLLWDLLRPVVKKLRKGIVPSERISGINFYIRQLNELDPDSAQFRYTKGIENTKNKLRTAQKQGTPVDLRTFADAMERLANFLDGLDGYVAALSEEYGET
jgi:hypothetical protein